MSVIFKISYGSDIRRISVSASTSFAEFTELVRKLFIDAIAENFVVKYTDDEGDLVSITSDRELAEAFAFANGKPLLRLSIVEVKPKVPAPAPAPTPSAVPEREVPKPSAAAPLPADPIFGIIEQALETPELQGLIGAFGFSTEGIKNIISGLKTEVFDDEKGKEKEQESEKEKESENVHEAYCDHCDKRIVGVRYKCSVCCDFDLCSACEAMLPSASVHDPQHLFLKVFTPVALPSRRPMLRNFYLEPAGQGCHWRRWGPGGPRGQWGGPWSGRRCHWRQNQCNSNAESASTSDTPVTETCPRWQRPGQNWLSSRFICDVTINDGTQMEPNNAFHKVWRLKNTGNNDWPAGTALTFIAGDSLTRGQDAAVIAEAVKPGEEINVGIDMVAPEKAGRYISNFRLVTPDGISFGHRVWADIMVVLPDAAAVSQPGVVEEKKKEEEVPVVVPQPVVVEEKKPEEPTPVPAPVVVVEEKKPEEPAPAPAPAPLLPILEVGYPYAQQLAALISMGFADVDANKKALNKRKGNVVAAVNDLLG